MGPDQDQGTSSCVSLSASSTAFGSAGLDSSSACSSGQSEMLGVSRRSSSSSPMILAEGRPAGTSRNLLNRPL
jgi:hypothetical protein